MRERMEGIEAWRKGGRKQEYNDEGEGESARVRKDKKEVEMTDIKCSLKERENKRKGRRWVDYVFMDVCVCE